jgi:hypothetical protein
VSYRSQTFTITANGNTNWQVVGGGSFQISVEGTFNGATVKYQQTTDDASGDIVENDLDGEKIFSVTEARCGIVEIMPCYIRFNVSGGTSPTLKIKITRTSGTDLE